MVRNSLRARAVTLALAGLIPVLPVRAADRLDRFRELATTRLAVPDASGGDQARQEVWALVDAEVLENLGAGGLFGEIPFIRDRLEQLGDAWGGASLRVIRSGDVLIGAFEIAGAPPHGTARVYRGAGSESRLLLAIERAARPVVRLLPSANGGGQFFVVWEGPATAHGSRALSVDLVRHDRHAARVAWSTGGPDAEPLRATAWSLGGAELRVRTELVYPGWTPGCARQTEQEDVYRLVPPPGTVEHRVPRVHDAWHREARAAAARLFEALATGDGRALAALVPDARIRARLPALTPAPVCDALVGRPGEAVLLGASEADGRPWSVLLRRSPAGWRIADASPVLE